MKRLIFVSLLLAAATVSVAFKPFPDSKSVCPRCPQPFDVVKMFDGNDLGGRVIAETPLHWVLMRFHVIRAIEKNKVSTIKWEKGTPTPGLDRVDVIVLKNGVTFAGKIVHTDPGRYFQLRRGKYVYTVWNKLIEHVFQNGARVNFTVHKPKIPGQDQ